jgi:hypothetical protein
MDSKKIIVKLQLEPGAPVAVGDWVGTFHDFIREERLPDEVLVDVADYAHVHQGPAVLLVAVEGHYGIDGQDGRTALFYARKRGGASLTLVQAIRDALRRVFRAAAALEAAMGAKVKFRGNELAVGVADRLHAPNTPETLQRLEPVLREALAPLWPGATLAFERDPDAGRPFAVRVHGGPDRDVRQILDRLGG